MWQTKEKENQTVTKEKSALDNKRHFKIPQHFPENIISKALAALASLHVKLQ